MAGNPKVASSARQKRGGGGGGGVTVSRRCRSREFLRFPGRIENGVPPRSMMPAPRHHRVRRDGRACGRETRRSDQDARPWPRHGAGGWNHQIAAPFHPGDGRLADARRLRELRLRQRLGPSQLPKGQILPMQAPGFCLDMLPRSGASAAIFSSRVVDIGLSLHGAEVMIEALIDLGHKLPAKSSLIDAGQVTGCRKDFPVIGAKAKRARRTPPSPPPPDADPRPARPSGEASVCNAADQNLSVLNSRRFKFSMPLIQRLNLGHSSRSVSRPIFSANNGPSTTFRYPGITFVIRLLGAVLQLSLMSSGVEKFERTACKACNALFETFIRSVKDSTSENNRLSNSCCWT